MPPTHKMLHNGKRTIRNSIRNSCKLATFSKDLPNLCPTTTMQEAKPFSHITAPTINAVSKHPKGFLETWISTLCKCGHTHKMRSVAMTKSIIKCLAFQARGSTDQYQPAMLQASIQAFSMLPLQGLWATTGLSQMAFPRISSTALHGTLRFWIHIWYIHIYIYIYILNC